MELPDDIQDTTMELAVLNGKFVLEVTYYYHEWPYGLQQDTKYFELTETTPL